MHFISLIPYIYTINMKFNKIFFTSILFTIYSTVVMASSSNVDICSGSSYFFNGVYITTSGSYLDTIVSSSGGDSIITLNLTVHYPKYDSIQVYICTGSSYFFNGDTITSSGNYIDTFHSYFGCDSFVILQLDVSTYSSITSTDSMCHGSSYLFNGISITSMGTYYDTLSATGSCDTIVILHLIYKDNATSTYFDTICNGDTFSYGAQNITTSGIYYDTLTGANGCDSFAQLYLEVIPRPSVELWFELSRFYLVATPGFRQYYWYANNIFIDSTSSNRYPIFVDEPLPPIPFFVIVSNGFCIDTSNILSTVHIEENNLNKSFLKYPNPVCTTLHIKLDALYTYSDEEYCYVIKDLMGREIIKEKIMQTEFDINTTNLAKGIYIIQIGNKIQAFIKE